MMGGVAASAVTSITVQNTLGIQEFHDLSATVVRQQVEAIINDLQLLFYRLACNLLIISV
jgi:hydroxymethylpyrimidine/phosphomethylpyrimidine kinase